jgi:hypothetical protein
MWICTTQSLIFDDCCRATLETSEGSKRKRSNLDLADFGDESQQIIFAVEDEAKWKREERRGTHHG